MPKIWERILRYIIVIAICVIAAVLFVALLVQFSFSTSAFLRESKEIFNQLDEILDNSNKEKFNTETKYMTQCFNKAECLSNMIENSDELMKALEKLEKNIDELAEKKGLYTYDNTTVPLYNQLKEYLRITEVDEVHIFAVDPQKPTENAYIIFGNVPEYIGYCLDDGEQMGYFKAMLNDRRVTRLYQNVTPNTAKEDPMQYSMIWSSNKKYLIEIGLKPSTISLMLKQYELSSLFTLIRSGDDVIFAVDRVTLSVKGSTNSEINDNTPIEQLGFKTSDLKKEDAVFKSVVNDVDYFCTVHETGDYYVVRMISRGNILRNIATIEILLFIGTAVLTATIIIAVLLCIKRIVISNIHKLNGSLRRIANGNLEENIDQRDCLEFAELGDHINAMVQSLLSSTDKISFVLNQSEMHIGVYEYNDSMSHVRCTENLAQILNMTESELTMLSSDIKSFKKFIEKIFANHSDSEKGVYRYHFVKDGKMRYAYLKIEQTEHNGGVLGIIADVTEDIEKRQKIENERDNDVLTGLNNRRAVERKLETLFENYRDLGYGVMIMLDADGLKTVNDKYGHENGDVYLRKIAQVLSDFTGEYSVCGRVGGDEFILFLYKFESKDAVQEVIEKLKEYQDNTDVALTTGDVIKLQFSFGCALSFGYSDYKVLEHLADDQMYRSKRLRKKNS